MLATALSIVFLRWHLHYMLFAFVHEAIVKRLGLMTVSILDGRSVPFDAPGPRSGGGDMQILTCFKFFLVADCFGSAFPAREQKGG